LGILSAYIPASWFHARGIFKVLAKLEPRLPNVGGKLFLTFTVNPAFYGSPADAFEHARDRLRRVFHRLKRGVKWQGQIWRIAAPYCIKVEFHRSGWAHFHAIFLTNRFLPGALLNELWGLGRTNVRRITNEHFRYLLKYVTKGGALPDWILTRRRLRVFQSSRGFLKPAEKAEPAEKQTARQLKRPSTVLGQRLKEWERSALLRQGERRSRLLLAESFQLLLDQYVFPVASEGRYLGNGQILINDTTQIIPWITSLNQSPLR